MSHMGCMNHGCVFGDPPGQALNGRCHCLDELPPEKRMRVRKSLAAARQREQEVLRILNKNRATDTCECETCKKTIEAHTLNCQTCGYRGPGVAIACQCYDFACAELDKSFDEKLLVYHQIASVIARKQMRTALSRLVALDEGKERE